MTQVCRHLTAANLQRETASLLASQGIKKKLVYYKKDKDLMLPEGIDYVQVFDML